MFPLHPPRCTSMATCDPLIIINVARSAPHLSGQMYPDNSQRCERGWAARGDSRPENRMAVFAALLRQGQDIPDYDARNDLVVLQGSDALFGAPHRNTRPRAAGSSQSRSRWCSSTGIRPLSCLSLGDASESSHHRMEGPHRPVAKSQFARLLRYSNDRGSKMLAENPSLFSAKPSHFHLGCLARHGRPSLGSPKGEIAIPCGGIGET